MLFVMCNNGSKKFNNNPVNLEFCSTYRKSIFKSNIRKFHTIEFDIIGSEFSIVWYYDNEDLRNYDFGLLEHLIYGDK